MKSLKARLWTALALGMASAGLYLFSTGPLAASDSKPADQPSAEQKTQKKPAKKKLTGSELFAIHCNRCHAERYPTERTAAQWKTLMLHMRVRANLPEDQAKTILKYLQEDSGK